MATTAAPAPSPGAGSGAGSSAPPDKEKSSVTASAPVCDEASKGDTAWCERGALHIDKDALLICMRASTGCLVYSSGKAVRPNQRIVVAARADGDQNDVCDSISDVTLALDGKASETIPATYDAPDKATVNDIAYSTDSSIVLGPRTYLVSFAPRSPGPTTLTMTVTRTKPDAKRKCAAISAANRRDAIQKQVNEDLQHAVDRKTTADAKLPIANAKASAAQQAARASPADKKLAQAASEAANYKTTAEQEEADANKALAVAQQLNAKVTSAVASARAKDEWQQRTERK